MISYAHYYELCSIISIIVFSFYFVVGKLKTELSRTQQLVIFPIQCFDIIGWVTGRASACNKSPVSSPKRFFF